MFFVLWLNDLCPIYYSIVLKVEEKCQTLLTAYFPQNVFCADKTKAGAVCRSGRYIA